MTLPYTCNNCCIQIDYEPTNERGCIRCGYPFNLSEILGFLKSNLSCIRRVERIEFSDVREISIADAFRQLDENEDMLFPERFTGDEIVISIENTKFRFLIGDYPNSCLKSYNMISFHHRQGIYLRHDSIRMMRRGEVHKERIESGRHAEDLYYVNLLIAGDSRAWDLFYREYRRKVESYIGAKYPNTFGSADIEEICDGVQKRLMNNDFRALKEYRGECSLSRYLANATDWEIRDWFKKNSRKLHEEPIETALNREELSVRDPFDKPEDNISKAVSSLPEDIRQAFLLRHYDHFGFPPEEIRLLSRKRGIPIKEASEMIIRHLELKEEGLLSSRRENRQNFEDRLQRLFSNASKLRDKEKKLLDKAKETQISGMEEEYRKTAGELKEIRDRLASIEQKRELLMKEGNTAVTTPYETIGMILGEDNVSTVRSRVFHARKILKDILQKEGSIVAMQHNEGLHRLKEEKGL
jgi:DNA-directed RNA polymerase specialized sigma24 family protein